MTPWEARWERIIRTDVARSVRLWSRTSTGVRGARTQPIAGKARTVYAGDRSHPERNELAVEAQHDGNAVIVMLTGEFDLAMAEPVRVALGRAIGDPKRRLIVDLSELTFIDSSGLHVILDAYKLCGDDGPTLSIRPGPPNVQKVFELTNLLDYLPFETSC